ncbi:MAG: tryptophan synthase alpha chain [Rickettsiaceae bacterium]|jgi:tryptophan synthase alpha chain|nr:tryptophan synthase alpha chain [Rickettsiaceae bacterium]
MTRIKQTFQNLKNKTAFIGFVTAGDPDYQTSLEIIKSMAKSGADIIELGVPFLDPAGDGPTIDAASKRAVKAGMNLRQVLRMVSEFRLDNKTTPIVLMGYYNPILHYGLEQFCVDASKAGVDGILVVDLPPEEDLELKNFAEKNQLDFIKLIALTSDQKRIGNIAQNASGFLYLVSILGITGTKSADLNELKSHLQKIKQVSNLPVAIGFGIKSKEQVREVASIGADAVVVGSALVKVIEEAVEQKTDKKLISGLVAKKVLSFV